MHATRRARPAGAFGSGLFRHLLGILFCTLLCVPSLSGSADAAEGGAPGPAIVLAAFGSSASGAVSAYETIEKRVREVYPEHDLRWAWTSAHVRRKVARDQARVPGSPSEVLDALGAEGFTRVVVQSLHVIPGHEFAELERAAARFTALGPDHRAAVGAPLLHDARDLTRAARALAAFDPPLGPGEASVLIGHGSSHPSAARYPALQDALRLVNPNVLVGVVEDEKPLLSFANVTSALKARRIRSVRLAPLMTVAGVHARDDIAGAEASSWQSRLRAESFSCRSELVGLGDRPAMVEIWLDHLARAVAEATPVSAKDGS